MELRDYQETFVEDLLMAIERGERPCGVAPTGSGKTVCGAVLINQYLAKRPEFRVIWMAHRRELIDQAAGKLREDGLAVGMILAGEPVNLSRPVQVASIQTLSRRDKPKADLIVLDECHHSRSASYAALIELYPGVPILGLSATPFRSDGQGLGDVFDGLYVAAYTDDLVARGYLVNPTVYAPAEAIDLKGVGSALGDYNLQALGRAVDKRELVGHIVETWKKRAGGLRTICFAVNKEHSRHIVEDFRAAGVRAEHLDDSCGRDDRKNALKRLRDGHTQVISNVDLFGEGVDIPVLECVIQARPTQSLGLHCQQLGRCMRPAPGKTFAVVLDHAGNAHRHGLVTDRIEYSLKGKAVRKSDKAGAGAAVKQCPKCYALVGASAAVCRAMVPTLSGLQECGHLFVTSTKEIEQRPGELVEVTSLFDLNPLIKKPKEADPKRKDFVLRKLMKMATEKNYKPGWAKYKFKAIFGHWPNDGELRRAAS